MKTASLWLQALGLKSKEKDYGAERVVTELDSESIARYIFNDDPHWRRRNAPKRLALTGDPFRLDSIEGLRAVETERVEELDVSENELVTMDTTVGQESFPNLLRLDASRNYLMSVSIDTKALTHLLLSYNRLTNFPDLSSLTNLVHLDVSHNQISSSTLKALAPCVYLQYVDASCNNLSVRPSVLAEDFDALARLEQLSYLDFRNNPFAACFPEYSIYALRVISSLTAIDGQAVTDNTRSTIDRMPFVPMKRYNAVFESRMSASMGGSVGGKGLSANKANSSVVAFSAIAENAHSVRPLRLSEINLVLEEGLLRPEKTVIALEGLRLQGASFWAHGKFIVTSDFFVDSRSSPPEVLVLSFMGLCEELVFVCENYRSHVFEALCSLVTLLFRTKELDKWPPGLGLLVGSALKFMARFQHTKGRLRQCLVDCLSKTFLVRISDEVDKLLLAPSQSTAATSARQGSRRAAVTDPGKFADFLKQLDSVKDAMSTIAMVPSLRSDGPTGPSDRSPIGSGPSGTRKLESEMGSDEWDDSLDDETGFPGMELMLARFAGVLGEVMAVKHSVIRSLGKCFTSRFSSAGQAEANSSACPDKVVEFFADLCRTRGVVCLVDDQAFQQAVLNAMLWLLGASSSRGTDGNSSGDKFDAENFEGNRSNNVRDLRSSMSSDVDGQDARGTQDARGSQLDKEPLLQASKGSPKGTGLPGMRSRSPAAIPVSSISSSKDFKASKSASPKVLKVCATVALDTQEKKDADLARGIFQIASALVQSNNRATDLFSGRDTDIIGKIQEAVVGALDGPDRQAESKAFCGPALKFLNLLLRHMMADEKSKEGARQGKRDKGVWDSDLGVSSSFVESCLSCVSDLSSVPVLAGVLEFFSVGMERETFRRKFLPDLVAKTDSLLDLLQLLGGKRFELLLAAAGVTSGTTLAVLRDESVLSVFVQVCSLMRAMNSAAAQGDRSALAVCEALNDGDRDNILMSLMSTVCSDSVRSEAARCLRSTLVSQLDKKEVEELVGQLRGVKDITSGRMEEVWMGVAGSIRQILSEQSPAAQLMMDAHGTEILSAALDILLRNTKRSSYGLADEEVQRLGLNRAIIELCDAVLARSHNPKQLAVAAISQFESEKRKGAGRNGHTGKSNPSSNCDSAEADQCAGLFKQLLTAEEAMSFAEKSVSSLSNLISQGGMSEEKIMDIMDSGFERSSVCVHFAPALIGALAASSTVRMRYRLMRILADLCSEPTPANYTLTLRSMILADEETFFRVPEILHFEQTSVTQAITGMRYLPTLISLVHATVAGSTREIQSDMPEGEFNETGQSERFDGYSDTREGSSGQASRIAATSIKLVSKFLSQSVLVDCDADLSDVRQIWNSGTLDLSTKLACMPPSSVTSSLWRVLLACMCCEDERLSVCALEQLSFGDTLEKMFEIASDLCTSLPAKEQPLFRTSSCLGFMKVMRAILAPARCDHIRSKVADFHGLRKRLMRFCLLTIDTFLSRTIDLIVGKSYACEILAEVCRCCNCAVQSSEWTGDSCEGLVPPELVDTLVSIYRATYREEKDSTVSLYSIPTLAARTLGAIAAYDSVSCSRLLLRCCRDRVVKKHDWVYAKQEAASLKHTSHGVRGLDSHSRGQDSHSRGLDHQDQVEGGRARSSTSGLGKEIRGALASPLLSSSGSPRLSAAKLVKGGRSSARMSTTFKDETVDDEAERSMIATLLSKQLDENFEGKVSSKYCSTKGEKVINLSDLQSYVVKSQSAAGGGSPDSAALPDGSGTLKQNSSNLSSVVVVSNTTVTLIVRSNLKLLNRILIKDVMSMQLDPTNCQLALSVKCVENGPDVQGPVSGPGGLLCVLDMLSYLDMVEIAETISFASQCRIRVSTTADAE